MKYLIQLLFVAFIVEGCNSQPKKPETTAPTSTVAPIPTTNDYHTSVTPDSQAHEYALYMAGMLKDGKYIPAKLTGNKYYKDYCAKMDANFGKIEKNRLSVMRNWSTTELKDELANPGTLFYPFSGPDILHAVTFYPNASQYVLIALERPGDIPDFKKYDSAQASTYLRSIDSSLQDIFGKSYFITRKMIQQLQKNKVNGGLPLMCLFLERTGHEVVAIHKNHLNNDGTVKPLPADSQPTHLNDFVEVFFKTPGTDVVRKVTYFRANLGDDPLKLEQLPSLKENKALSNYIDSLPAFYCYAKSASYLMNYASFSAIRNKCLSKSKSILQDDTGIGFDFFDKKIWRVKFYGHYVTPVRDFKGVYDVKLAEAYKTDSASVKPLPFSLGYHWGDINNQNLMKAEKISAKP